MKGLNLIQKQSPVKANNLVSPFFYSPDDLLISCILLSLFLLPVYIISAGRFGFKVLILLGACAGTGFLIEFLGGWLSKKRIQYLGISTWVIFPLLVPPGMPLWTVLLCFVLAIVISQIFFGGFGFHVFHPAVVGQVFLMINFLSLYNSSFIEPFKDPFFGFSSYSSLSFTDLTTLLTFKNGAEVPFKELFAGPNVGTYGAVFPYLMAIGGALYLYFGRVNRLTPLFYAVSVVFFSYVGHLVRPDKLLGIIPTVFTGDVLIYLFFIFSDRWTSSKTHMGRIIAGIIAGFLTIMIRSFSINSEGVLFAAMFSYAFIPLYDEISFSIQRKRERGYEEEKA